MALEKLDRKPTFVCQAPRLDDLLPLNIDGPMRSVGRLASTGVYVSAVTIKKNYSPEYWTFAQAAQAAFLLDVVIKHIYDNTLDEDAKTLNGVTIDQQLQAFLITMMHQPKVKGLDVCLAYTLVMRYVSET